MLTALGRQGALQRLCTNLQTRKATTMRMGHADAGERAAASAASVSGRSPLAPASILLLPCTRIRAVFCRATSTARQAARAAPRSTPRGAPTPASTVSPDAPWLIVGLGNPGPQYEKTRHNVGFMVVDALARSEGIDMRKLEKSAAVGRGELRGRRVILAKPMTFMNNSGESVGALARFYKVPPSRVLVVSDDLDQATAAVRLRAKGGHGGHNGLRSIIHHLQGTQDFPRLKIGIGRPNGQTPVASYVLQPFSKSELADIDGAIAEALRVIDAVMALGMDKALSGSRL